MMKLTRSSSRRATSGPWRTVQDEEGPSARAPSAPARASLDGTGHPSRPRGSSSGSRRPSRGSTGRRRATRRLAPGSALHPSHLLGGESEDDRLLDHPLLQVVHDLPLDTLAVFDLHHQHRPVLRELRQLGQRRHTVSAIVAAGVPSPRSSSDVVRSRVLSRMIIISPSALEVDVALDGSRAGRDSRLKGGRGVFRACRPRPLGAHRRGSGPASLGEWFLDRGLFHC